GGVRTGGGARRCVCPGRARSARTGGTAARAAAGRARRRARAGRSARAGRGAGRRVRTGRRTCRGTGGRAGRATAGRAGRRARAGRGARAGGRARRGVRTGGGVRRRARSGRGRRVRTSGGVRTGRCTGRGAAASACRRATGRPGARRALLPEDLVLLATRRHRGGLLRKELVVAVRKGHLRGVPLPMLVGLPGSGGDEPAFLAWAPLTDLPPSTRVLVEVEAEDVELADMAVLVLVVLVVLAADDLHGAVVPVLAATGRAGGSRPAGRAGRRSGAPGGPRAAGRGCRRGGARARAGAAGRRRRRARRGAGGLLAAVLTTVHASDEPRAVEIVLAEMLDHAAANEVHLEEAGGHGHGQRVRAAGERDVGPREELLLIGGVLIEVVRGRRVTHERHFSGALGRDRERDRCGPALVRAGDVAVPRNHVVPGLVAVTAARRRACRRSTRRSGGRVRSGGRGRVRSGGRGRVRTGGRGRVRSSRRGRVRSGGRGRVRTRRGVGTRRR